jgi:hypothetical protein
MLGPLRWLPASRVQAQALGMLTIGNELIDRMLGRTYDFFGRSGLVSI